MPFQANHLTKKQKYLPAYIYGSSVYYLSIPKIKKEKSNNAFFAKYYMLRIWPFQLVNHSSPPSKFSKQKTSTNKQAYISFDNQ